MNTHNLKTWPDVFQKVRDGLKPWEVRRNDRDFQTGDLLILEEWDPVDMVHTGRFIKAKAGFIMYGGQFGLPEDMCVITLETIDLPCPIKCIKIIISDVTNITIEAMEGQSKTREDVIARKLAIYFCHKVTIYSTKTIGYHFGKRDHSTVIHALRTIDDMNDTDKAFQLLFRQCKEKIEEIFFKKVVNQPVDK